MNISRKAVTFLFAFIVFALSEPHASFAECLTSDFGYTIDFPEGVVIDDMEQNQSIVILSHKYFQIKSILRIWNKQEYKDASTALSAAMSKLNLKSESTECQWQNKKCSISMFQGNIQGTQSSGWAVSIPLQQDKGYLTALVYCQEQLANDLSPVIISILDSIMIDYTSSKSSGIITSTFYPRTQPQQITLNISNHSIISTIDKCDSEANQAVLDREWGIFMVYASYMDITKAQEAPVLIAAWQRFYRILARDSLARLSDVSNDIYMSYIGELNSTSRQDNDLKLAQELLTWSQNFKYERTSTQSDKADITNVIDVLLGKSSDCDSRSMLLAVLLKNLDMDTCFFISAQYGHAMFGIHLSEKKGQSIIVDQKEYLVGETTAKNVSLGMIPADKADRKFWYPVEFYY